MGRARVPQAEMSEYVSRPAWQTTVNISDKKQKKGVSSMAVAVAVLALTFNDLIV